MPGDFDRFFRKIPDTCKRHEDGYVGLDESHPVVIEFWKQADAAHDAGMSWAEILKDMKQLVAESRREVAKSKEAKDGR